MGSEASDEQQQLHVLFFPLMALGHSIPILDLAHLFASRNVCTTLLLTPYTATLFPNPTAPNIHIRHIHIPTTVTAPAGLPDGFEPCASTPNLYDVMSLFGHLHHFEPYFRSLVSDIRPDAIVSDMCFPWTLDVARDLNIPRLVFTGSNYFQGCVSDAIHRFMPDKHVASDDEPFIVPGLPHTIQFTKSKMPNFGISEAFQKLFEQIYKSEEESFGVIMNSFYDLESAYIEHTTAVLGRKTWPVGPVCLHDKENKLKDCRRGKQSVVEVDECLSWLDSKQPKSVLYICFGSMCTFTPAQNEETAAAIEMLGCNFLWVVKPSEVLPDGFKERVGDKGMIITGWAPQLLILNHEATSAFVTHCGWNSALESVCAGVPMVTWPVFAEQFYNEKLISTVLKIGVEVGARRWEVKEEGREVVGRAAVAAAVKAVMEEGEEMRRRVKELGELGRKAMEVGGSSYVSLTMLIEELTDIKKNRGFKS